MHMLLVLCLEHQHETIIYSNVYAHTNLNQIASSTLLIYYNNVIIIWHVYSCLQSILCKWRLLYSAKYVFMSRWMDRKCLSNW